MLLGGVVYVATAERDVVTGVPPAAARVSVAKRSGAERYPCRCWRTVILVVRVPPPATRASVTLADRKARRALRAADDGVLFCTCNVEREPSAEVGRDLVAQLRSVRAAIAAAGAQSSDVVLDGLSMDYDPPAHYSTRPRTSTSPMIMTAEAVSVIQASSQPTRAFSYHLGMPGVQSGPG